MCQEFLKMWCDQAKSVWSRSNSVFIFLTNWMHHFYSYILKKTPLKLVNWFQRYEQVKDAKNSRKQKTFSALFGSILKSIFPTSDWFCLITSQISSPTPTISNNFQSVRLKKSLLSLAAYAYLINLIVQIVQWKGELCCYMAGK